MLIPDILKEIMTSMREDYCFLVNHLAVLIMALALIYMDDERSNRLLKPLLLGVGLILYPFHASYIFTLWGDGSYKIMLNFLFLPIVAAYTIYCISEKYEGKKRVAAIIICLCIVVACCSFDHWSIEHFRINYQTIPVNALLRTRRISFVELLPWRF